MTPEGAARVVCPSCSERVAALDVIRRLSARVPATHSYVSRCPRCGHAMEFTVRSGALHVGYTYWAGALHFDTTDVCGVRGLREIATDEGPVLGVEGEIIRVPPPER